MTGIALAIVLSAGFLHAGWNFLLKKSSRKIVFTWWFLLAALILYLPMFLYFWPRTPISGAGWRFVLATGLIHGFYFSFMGGAYERGDLSLVYPLSRGFGPMLVPVLAVIWLKEQLREAKIRRCGTDRLRGFFDRYQPLGNEMHNFFLWLQL
jgi:multidrug transporter EmrE-like cation transporter